jgi:ABC-type multidrug transport system fused ATPase/permease subunit
LFRLYDVTGGEIRVGGKNIKDYPLKELRSQIAMVTQTVELFQGTLRDNITLFNRDISDEQVRNVIENVGLGPWLASLEEGLDTEISSSNGFSAGESQLIAFTRVFLRDPKIVVLDEASSRLDPFTEVLVDKAVEKLLENRTAIIIAHRLATLNQVDTIAIIEDGSVVEQGDREKLEQNENSKYYQLLKTGILELEVSQE